MQHRSWFTSLFAAFAAFAACVALASGCSECGVVDETPEGLTPEAHSVAYFPIVEGPHAVDCTECHKDETTFKAFDCLSCHEHEPIATDLLHETAQPVAGTAYAYESPACYTCHPQGVQIPPFDHASGQNQCATCHAEGAAFAALPIDGFTHPERGNNDCGTCHFSTTDWAEVAAFPAELVADSLMNIDVIALLPRYAGTSIVSVTPDVQTLPMPMNHATTQLDADTLVNCAACHNEPATYYPGKLHSALANLFLAQPTACAECHRASVPTGFVGPLATDPPRNPASGEMKHDAVAWLNDAPTPSGIVPIECGTCHTPPSQAFAATWASGAAGRPPEMHASLELAALPQPDSCIDCHANTRPANAFTSADGLPVGVVFDHAAPNALGDCVRCHAASLDTGGAGGGGGGAGVGALSWSDGRFHSVGDATPPSCLPCHEGERPISTSTWADPDYQRRPFDFVTNDVGITHGAGQDCVTCHASPGSGDWGVDQTWQRGEFPHGIGTIAENTCIACHSTQRPDLVVGNAAALLGFDHVNDGAGDCVGCHQASVEAGLYATYFDPATGTLPGGDWQGGVTFPGDFPIGSQNQFITVTEITLLRSGPNNLVTSTIATTATFYNQMLHTSSILPASLDSGSPTNPDETVCWHCHTNNNGNVTSFVNGVYHEALDTFRATPGGPVAALPQPTSNCVDCHVAPPNNIVERAASPLQPMDHDVLFTTNVTLDGRSVNGVAAMDCSSCHTAPGDAWDDGVFHANIGAAVPQDCTQCHYPTMAVPGLADVSEGSIYTMRHASLTLTFQNCQTCHAGALAQATQTPLAATLWSGGVLHPEVTAQPAACLECHANSEPTAPTQSSVAYTLTQGASATNERQWMSHTARYIVTEDCARCHATDARAAGSTWSTSTPFHANTNPNNVTTCSECHGAGNGSSVAGTGNNMPAALVDTQTVTTAANNPATGIAAGTRDRISHFDANVARHDCNFCHAQQGPSTAAGVTGEEWAQARFHRSFGVAEALLLDGTTGRCSNCHENVKPGAAYPFDHAAFSAAPGTQDCSSCHSFPGTGTIDAPNWLGPAGGFPQLIAVGGFVIPNPPAASAGTIQAGIANLPHPTPGATACTACHLEAVGGKNATGYDHGSTLINTKCASCHEAGTNLIGTPWNDAVDLAAGAGDSRPFTLATLTVTTAKYPGESLAVSTPDHFFGTDCFECHAPPAGVATVTTGAAYGEAWSFAHDEARMTNPDTCIACHGETGLFPPDLVDDPLRALSVDTLVPTYAGTSIVAVTADTQLLPMSMDHLSPEVPASLALDCQACHTDTVTFYPGLLHSAFENLLLPQPQSCVDCHLTAVPQGFVGPLAADPPRNPASGEMKHDAVVWINGAPTNGGLVPLECSTCHLPPTRALPSTTWQTGVDGVGAATFHDALTTAAVAQPDQCLDCHANSRPATTFTSSNSTLPPGVVFDHREPAALGECVACHASEAYAAWDDGLFHNVGDATPTSCLPCHEGERPTTTAAWLDPGFEDTPFDFVTNALGVEHGAGQDCVECHASPGTGGDWGIDQNWTGGFFTHGADTLATSTCISCHTTQRPDLVIANAAALLGFDHATEGTGDCIGCHQQSITDAAFADFFNPATGTLPGGDWQGGISYPGDVLVSSGDNLITVTQIALVRSGALNLVTSTTSSTATLFNAMLHTSVALPASLNGGPTDNPDSTTCFHCHTNNAGVVTSFANGEYHASLDVFRATPGGALAPLPQPTICLDCHAQMKPRNIVERAGSFLQPMDHDAAFTGTVNIGGRSVNNVNAVDCGVCHRDPGGNWNDGVFHARIGAAVPQDCNVCHYVAMANTAVSDVTSGTTFKMKHASTQIRFQNCQVCHTAALARGSQTPLAATQWSGGLLHPAVSPQPIACLECHANSDPTQATQSTESYTLALGGTPTNAAQWMSHTTTSVTGRDCVQCHAADARTSGSAWNRGTRFHPATPVTTCSVCHGTANGRGTTVGTNNNLPQGLTNSGTVTTASSDATTGIAVGTRDQIIHTDVNVTGRDCNICHVQTGSSTTAPIAGKEWAQADFHIHFTGAGALLMNGTTGRCSNCHLNVKPGATYTSFNHGAFAGSGTTDCSSCHSWPGTGTTTAPNWQGAEGGFPPFLSVGGFTIPRPPAATTGTTQAGVANLPHPTGTTACTACHTDGGGRRAIGYDHASTVANRRCNSCHEAGSDLVGTVWNGATAIVGAGDTRPFTITSLVTRFSGNSITVNGGNHFFPVDCYECHDAPTGVATVTTGTTYTTRWRFPHRESRMTNPATCRLCHGNDIPN